MTKLPGNVNLSVMFGLDLAPANDSIVDHGEAAMCAKCHGRGNFIAHTGRIVGPCFTCNGTGLAHTFGKVLAADDCVKCAGTGEYSPGRACFACKGSGKIAAATQIDVSAIATAFAAAHSHGIKRPKLRLDTFQFSRAPDHGRNAGSIYVKHAGSGEYMGKVTDGKFHKSRECDDPTRDAIVAVAADPATAAKAYGQKTGTCSCCGRELTNGLSIELGIGPICAQRYGW